MTLAERTAELAALHAELLSARVAARRGGAARGGHGGGGQAAAGGRPRVPADEALIARALDARDGGAFGRLWRGRWRGEYRSQSEADLALCNHLAFWTGRDAARMDRLFRTSGLMREGTVHVD